MAYDYGYSEFTKLDCYLLKLRNEGKVSIVFKSDEAWFKWEEFYFFKGISGNFIRKGSIKESDTIYIGGVSISHSWIKRPDIKLINLFRESFEYWDLNIE